jgi:hypothetical protein
MFLAWNSPEEKEQYRAYVDALRGANPMTGPQVPELVDAMSAKYNIEFNPVDSNYYRTGQTGDMARDYLWNVIDRYDATPPLVRGNNPITTIPFNNQYGGQYAPETGRVEVAPPEGYDLQLFPEAPARNLQHELMHARTWEGDVPWDQLAPFIEDTWPGATQGANSITDVMRKYPDAREWPGQNVSDSGTSTPYGFTNPSEDLADYLGVMSYTRDPQNFPRQDDMDMANKWWPEEGPDKYKMALEMLRQLGVNVEQGR